MTTVPDQSKVSVPIKKATTLAHIIGGAPVFAAQDTDGRLYIITGIGRNHYMDLGPGKGFEKRAQPESYMFVETTPEQIAEFRAGQTDVNDLFQAAPDGRWYLIPEPTGFVSHLPLLPQSVPVNQCPFLPLTGLVTFNDHLPNPNELT